MPLLPLSLFSLGLHIPRVNGEEQLTAHDWYKSDLEFFLTYALPGLREVVGGDIVAMLGAELDQEQISEKL